MFYFFWEYTDLFITYDFNVGSLNNNKVYFLVDAFIIGLFFLGLVNICLNTKHIIFTYIGLEITLFSLVLLFGLLAHNFYSSDAYVVCFFLLVIAAADSVMGLALLILYKQYWNEANINLLNFSRR
jgi:NADH-quinone oxidoreductase subunit K